MKGKMESGIVENKRTTNVEIITIGMRVYKLNNLRNENQKDQDYRPTLMSSILSNESVEHRTYQIGINRKLLAEETEKELTHCSNLIDEWLANESDQQRSQRLSVILKQSHVVAIEVNECILSIVKLAVESRILH